MKLSEHNKQRAEVYEMLNRPESAGVDCDHCGKPMVFADKATLTSNPPKRRVKCECGATGTMLA